MTTLAFEELNYDGWPEPWWTVAFNVTEDFWELLMDINCTLGRQLSDTAIYAARDGHSEGDLDMREA